MPPYGITLLGHNELKATALKQVSLPACDTIVGADGQGIRIHNADKHLIPPHRVSSWKRVNSFIKSWHEH